MKCDELKPLVFSLNELSYIDETAVQKNFENPHDHAVYKSTEVDAAIAELKQKIEDAKATAYTDSVDAGMENRRLKRDLWLARAERAVAKQAYYDVLSRGISSERSEMYYLWNNVERKCRAKAEEYK